MLSVLIETSFPMVAGMVMALAEELKPPEPTVFPAGVCTKSNLNASSGRRLSLARSVGASKSLAVRSEFASAATVEKAMAERMKSPGIIVEGTGGVGRRWRRRGVAFMHFMQHSSRPCRSFWASARWAVSDQQRARA